MNIKQSIQDELQSYPIEDRQIILMQMEEKLNIAKYSRNDYKKALKDRKKVKRRRLKSDNKKRH